MWTGRGWLAGRPAGLRKARRIGERPSRNPLSARTHTPHSFLQYHKRKTLESLFSLLATQLPYQPIDHLSSRNAMRPRVGCRARPSSSTASPCSVVAHRRRTRRSWHQGGQELRNVSIGRDESLHCVGNPSLLQSSAPFATFLVENVQSGTIDRLPHGASSCQSEKVRRCTTVWPKYESAHKLTEGTGIASGRERQYVEPRMVQMLRLPCQDQMYRALRTREGARGHRQLPHGCATPRQSPEMQLR